MNWTRDFYLRKTLSLYKYKKFIKSFKLLNEFIDSVSESSRSFDDLIISYFFELMTCDHDFVDQSSVVLFFLHFSCVVLIFARSEFNK